MFDASTISRLCATVLHYDMGVHGIFPQMVKEAIEVMGFVYSPETTDFQSTLPMLANYDDVVYRCAYLHKYAPFHTHIVYQVMMEILSKEKLLFWKLVEEGKFHICSLGGGPGSDVIGVLAALRTALGSHKSKATVIDYFQDWEFTFKSILVELMSGGYGEAWNNLENDFRWKYLGTDLLFRLRGKAEKAVATSSLVTMIKFLSAAVCSNTDDMVKTIFRIMKPGALLLYIDNAGGGFSQMIEKAARENGFVVLFGPFKHLKYVEETFKVKRFGHTGCCSTTVAVFLLQKQMNQLATVKHNVDERTPLLHGRKKRKLSNRKALKENQILNPYKVHLPPDNNDDSKFGTVQNISQDLLDETPPIPNLPSPLIPIKHDPNHSLGKELSSQKPFQEKQIGPNYRDSSLVFNSHSRFSIDNFKPADPSRESDSNLPECSGYSQITVPDTGSDMDVREIDSKMLQNVLQSGTVIHSSLIHETTKTKRSQKVRIVPHSQSPSLSEVRNDGKSEYSQITVPDTGSDMDVLEIDSKIVQNVLQSGTMIHNSLIYETTKTKISQKVSIVPHSASPSLSAVRNDGKSNTLGGTKNRSLTLVFPITTQPASVSGIACGATCSHQPKETRRNICPSESKTSTASEIPTLQDESNEASRLMNSRIPSFPENRKQNNVSPENSHQQEGNFPDPSNASLSINNCSRPKTSEQMNCERRIRTVNSIRNYSPYPVVTIQPSSPAQINATRHRSEPRPAQRDMAHLEGDSCDEEELCCPESCCCC